MTGRLNPRRYDLGELRDAVRKPPRERTVGDSAANTDRGAARSPRDRSSHASEDAGRTVPVEPITETRPPEAATDASRPRSSDDSEASIENRSRPASGGASDRSAVRGTGPMSDSHSREPSGDSTARTANRTPPADAADVEAYLRSRHQRRADGRTAQEVQRDSDRRPSRGDARNGDREQRAESASAEFNRTPNATALLAELSGPAVSKPYLDRLPDAYTAQLEIFEWLEWMLAATGHDGTLTALAYYESIGWLSERSREALEDVVAGLSAPQATGQTLSIDDHRESLVHVARLAGRLRQ
ncbi:FlaD/FlaE family flagellar protein [Natronomonas salsuginis]|nr:FlaD/FlaE family flagellar protein [Natronomonas salsuginis]